MSEDKPQDVGDEKQVRKRKTKHHLERMAELEDLEKILKTYWGRAFIWRVLSECGVHHSSPYGSEEAYRHAGGRDKGIWLENEVLEANPNLYILMRDDAIQRDIEGKRNGT